MRTTVLILFSIFLAFPNAAALAMSSSNYTIPTDSLNGGGGDTSSSANYKILDTAGQTIAGSGASSTFGTEQGYRTRFTAIELSANFVDAAGAVIPTPTAVFTGITTGTTLATGALTTPTSKIRVTNTRAVAPWSLTIAATAGPTTAWFAGANSLGFNHPVAGSALTVDPSATVVSPIGALCTTTGVTNGAAATFNQGVVDSITLMNAGGSAMTGCAWDLTNINLTQTVPAAQTPGAYSLPMTITVA